MSNATITQMQQYFAEYYLTLDQLEIETKISKEQICKLIGAQCVPPHSFEVKQVMWVGSSLREAAIDAPSVRYYHPSLVTWISHAMRLAKEQSLMKVAIMVREQFIAEFEQAFQDKATPGCDDVNTAWRYLMNGTWGICLKNISIKYMAMKELARLKIAELSRHESLTGQQKTELQQAVDDYEFAVIEFAPHLVPTSSRRLEVEAAVEKYLNDEV